jgi:excisionase family DNA binding protein
MSETSETGERYTVSVPEAARMLGMNKATLRKEIESGRIPSIPCGNQKRIAINYINQATGGHASPPTIDPAEIARRAVIESLRAQRAILDAQIAAMETR